MDARVYEMSYTIHQAAADRLAVSLIDFEPTYARYRLATFVNCVYGSRYVQTAELMYRPDSDTYLLAATVEIGC